jgi:hypothetical protein
MMMTWGSNPSNSCRLGCLCPDCLDRAGLKNPRRGARRPGWWRRFMADWVWQPDPSTSNPGKAPVTMLDFAEAEHRIMAQLLRMDRRGQPAEQALSPSAAMRKYCEGDGAATTALYSRAGRHSFVDQEIGDDYPVDRRYYPLPPLQEAYRRAHPQTQEQARFVGRNYRRWLEVGAKVRPTSLFTRPKVIEGTQTYQVTTPTGSRVKVNGQCVDGHPGAGQYRRQSDGALFFYNERDGWTLIETGDRRSGADRRAPGSGDPCRMRRGNGHGRRSTDV